MAKLKISMTMDESVSDRIKVFAAQNGISFSGAVSVLCNQALAFQWAISENYDLLTHSGLEKVRDENK